jgi:hypothetical protein
MLLDDLLKARVVELGELGQIVHVGDDVAQVLLQQLKVLFRWAVVCRIAAVATVTVELAHNLGDLLLRCSYAPYDLLAFDLSEAVHLVQLGLELLHKLLLGRLVPGGVSTERVLEAFVVDVVEHPLLDKGGLELLAEPADTWLAQRHVILTATLGGAHNGLLGAREPHSEHTGPIGSSPVGKTKDVGRDRTEE